VGGTDPAGNEWGTNAVSMGRTLLLGLIAGGTILLGMPLGRVKRLSQALRAMLNAIAVGVLLFLVWDVLSAAWEPIDAALAAQHEGTGGLGPAFGYGLLFAGGLAIGLLGLVWYEGWLTHTAKSVKIAGPAGRPFGPGAMAAGELVARRGLATWSAGERLALLIAIGIGLHNFAEGLAIGQSSGSGEIGLATLLVIGFALHNATEGFGIVAPLAAEQAGSSPAPGEVAVDSRPSWLFLLGLAAIGGGPTFVGTAVGYSFTSEPVAVAFLTLAAGSMIYVVVQLLGLAARAPSRMVVCAGLLIGLLAGFATDAVVTAAGV
jgi:zinc transporter, ZIP family